MNCFITTINFKRILLLCCVVSFGHFLTKSMMMTECLKRLKLLTIQMYKVFFLIMRLSG